MRRYTPFHQSRSSSPEQTSPSLSPVSPLSAITRNNIDHFTHPKSRLNFEVPRLLSLWEYHPEYGIVHPMVCDICRSYMRHLSEASYSDNQPSFQIARTHQQQERKVFFADGVAEGRRLQKLENVGWEKDARRYRAERDRVQEEAASLRVRLEDLQTELGKLVSSSVNGAAHSATASAARALVDEPTRWTQNNVSSRTAWEPINSPSQPTPSTATAPATTSTVFSATSITSPPVLDSVSQSSDQEQAASASGPAPFQVVVRKKGAAPRSIQHAEKLMKSAHQPGNRTALLRVKALCRQAHETPRAEKTDVQRYLLAKWTNPTWDDETFQSTTSTRPPSLPTPRLEDPVDDHVAYFMRHRESMPRGIPRDARGSALRSYFQAHQIVGLLRPGKASGSEKPSASGTRTRFKLLAAQLFSDPSTYPHFLERNAITVARTTNYEPYPSSAEDATVEDVGRHFAACGVSVEQVEAKLSPWAREYLSAMAQANTIA